MARYIITYPRALIEYKTVEAARVAIRKQSNAGIIMGTSSALEIHGVMHMETFTPKLPKKPKLPLVDPPSD